MELRYIHNPNNYKYWHLFYKGNLRRAHAYAGKYRLPLNFKHWQLKDLTGKISVAQMAAKYDTLPQDINAMVDNGDFGIDELVIAIQNDTLPENFDRWFNEEPDGRKWIYIAYLETNHVPWKVAISHPIKFINALIK